MVFPHLCDVCKYTDIKHHYWTHLYKSKFRELWSPARQQIWPWRRSKVTVKVTTWYHQKGLVTRNTHAKYQSSICNSAKVMAKVKVFVTDGQTDRQTEGRMRFNVPTLSRKRGTTKLYCISGIFSVSKFWQKMALASLEGVFNFHRVWLLLFKAFSMEKYNEVYFSLCHFLVILWRLRTQRKFNPHIKFSI